MSETADEPTAGDLWDSLTRSIRHPGVGQGRRPAEVQVRLDERWESFRPDLDELGIRLAPVDTLPEMDHIFGEVCQHILGKPEPGLLDVPGVTENHLAGLYAAAATFFQRKPWKKVGVEAAVRVRCDRFESGPWYAVVMGQSGVATGVALYEDLATLRGMWDRGGGGDPEQNARDSVATTVTFGEPWEIPVPDLEAIIRHGWALARPDAYPSILHTERGRTTRPPLAWEIELMEGILQTLPEFVARRQQDDQTVEIFAPRVSSGSLSLELSWVPELD